MKELKAVFSDLDGTLLRDDKSISANSRKAIYSLKDQGIHFVIATGRGPMAVETVLEQIGFPVDMICYSGEYIERDGKKIFSNGFSFSEGLEIARFLDDIDVTYGAYSEDMWISPKRTKELEEEEALVRAKATIADIDILGEDAIINKFLAISDPQRVDGIIDSMRKRFPSYEILKSLDYLVEINKGGHNKGTACQKYCELSNIDPSSTLCFGDCYNDLGMLRLMPYACIMDNAPDDIKSEFIDDPNKPIVESNMQDGMYYELLRRGYINS